MWIWLWWAVGLSISTVCGLWVLRRRRDLGLGVLITIFAGYIVSANILAPRLIALDVGFGRLIVSTGSLIWPLTGQLSDMINEVYGRRNALWAMAISYVSNLLFVTFVFMAAGTEAVWGAEKEAAWREYFTPAGRILLASTTSFLVCQLIDITVYSLLKERFRRVEEAAGLSTLMLLGGFRSLVSDLINMVCDGIIFAVLAFAFVLSTSELLSLIYGSIITKALIIVIDKPWFVLFRLGIRNVRREV
jgi:hypothetical protein